MSGFSALVGKFLASKAAANALGFWRAYTGYQVQRRVSAEYATLHQWYGRYLINIFTSSVEAVDFQGIGPNFKAPANLAH